MFYSRLGFLSRCKHIALEGTPWGSKSEPPRSHRHLAVAEAWSALGVYEVGGAVVLFIPCRRLNEGRGSLAHPLPKRSVVLVEPRPDTWEAATQTWEAGARVNSGEISRPLPTHQCAHAGSRARVTSMGGLYDTATLHAPVMDVQGRTISSFPDHAEKQQPSHT